MKDRLKKLALGWSQGTSYRQVFSLGTFHFFQIYDELTNLTPCSFQLMLIFNNKEAYLKKYGYFPNRQLQGKFEFAKLVGTVPHPRKGQAGQWVNM